MTVFAEYFPVYFQYDPCVIIELPEKYATHSVCIQVLKTQKIRLDDLDYQTIVNHPSIESATARIRGCSYTLYPFSYKEEQKSQSSIKYIKYSEYKVHGKSVFHSGYIMPTAVIIYKNKTREILKDLGYDVGNEFYEYDGCSCRECKEFFHMAEPDGLKNDGMLTCYSCKERLKSYKLWPYK